MNYPIKKFDINKMYNVLVSDDMDTFWKDGVGQGERCVLNIEGVLCMNSTNYDYYNKLGSIKELTGAINKALDTYDDRVQAFIRDTATRRLLRF